MEYATIEKQQLLDAQKYIERADDYLKENKYGHACGCLAKAAKKITHTQHIYSITSDDGIGKILSVLINSLRDKVANKILKG